MLKKVKKLIKFPERNLFQEYFSFYSESHLKYRKEIKGTEGEATDTLTESDEGLSSASYSDGSSNRKRKLESCKTKSKKSRRNARQRTTTIKEKW